MPDYDRSDDEYARSRHPHPKRDAFVERVIAEFKAFPNTTRDDRMDAADYARRWLMYTNSVSTLATETERTTESFEELSAVVAKFKERTLAALKVPPEMLTVKTSEYRTQEEQDRLKRLSSIIHPTHPRCR